MKVAVVSSVFGNPWAGSEELWYQTMLQCIGQGHEVYASVFEVNTSCEQHENLRRRGGVLEYRKRFKNGRIHVLKHKYFSAFSNMIKWKPDVLILSLGSMSDLILYPDLERHISENRFSKIVMVCLFNSDNIILDSYTRNMITRFCKKTDHFVFVSHHNHLLAERQLAIKLSNVSVFSSPVSYLDSYAQLPWPQTTHTFQMACVARLDVVNKGQDILLESLSNEKWRNRSWKLSIYGKGGDEDYIRKLIEHYELNEKVEFSGFVSDTREIWRKNNIMVMASRSEGLSLALLEAMICGRICIVTDVGGHSEVIKDAVSGFLAEAAATKYFEAALDRAWNMQEDYNAITTAAHSSAMRIFKEKPVNKLLDIIFNN
jgi:L-malate glycosyltransferase